MSQSRSPIMILIADDDEDDRLMIEEAFAESQLINRRHYVTNGEELMDFLSRRGVYADREPAPRPNLILLDLNMPKKDGREALQEIKADPVLRHIPVVILTTSQAEEDILRTYDLGASSFITKPVTFAAPVEVIKVLKKYWFEIIALPPHKSKE